MRTSALLAAAVVAGSFLSPVSAEETEGLDGYTVTGNTETCLRTFLIDETDVVDDSTVLFHLKNGETYVNRMTKACPQLARHNSFTYDAHGVGQLCNTDTITVLYSNSPPELREGPTCPLNEFEELAEVQE